MTNPESINPADGDGGEDKGGKVPGAAVLPLVIVGVLAILVLVYFLAK